MNGTRALELFTDVLCKQENQLDINQALPILFVWLNIELTDEMQPSALPPEAQKELLFATLNALLLSQQFNLKDQKLCIVEDIHWADSSTREFLRHISESIDNNFALLMTSRNEVPEQLKDVRLKDVYLTKLTKEATESFIFTLFEGKDVAHNVLDILINRTDGIPLFIEELVGMLKQKELVHEKNGIVDFVNAEKLDQVPTSLRESLQQKIDSLRHAKETAQLAATIGREFDLDLLVSASPLSENQIQNDLTELIVNDLIVQQRRVNNFSYVFKHALVRDAVYNSIDRVSKKNLHIQIADSIDDNLEFDFKLTKSLHLQFAEQYSKAFDYLARLGQKCLEDCKYHHCEIAFSKAEFILNIPTVTIEATEKLALELGQASLCLATKGYGDDEVRDRYGRAIILAKTIENKSDLPRILWGIGVYYMVTGDFLESINTAEQAFNTIENIDDVDNIALSALISGSSLWLGRYKQAERIYEKSYNKINDANDPIFNRRYSYNISIAEISYYALTCAIQGRSIDAIKLSQKAISTAKDIGNPFSISHALARSSLVYIICGDFDTALEFANKALNLAEESDIFLWATVAKIMQQYCMISLGVQKDTVFIEEAISLYEDSGALANLPLYYIFLAKSYSVLNSADKEMSAMEKARKISSKTGEKFFIDKVNNR
ncbi:ATP-binding protein [Veronia nyctiphanis]|uniref:hypothetical protein n=1 Tax=Veronia nyctiphanis TaxID=1278244 RepID=UPI00191C1D1B|nr:hypothetical protein [Veronia nyctiphanis]